MKRCLLTAVGSSRVFGPAADPLFCSAKKVGQKRRPLRWRSALRADCTRRQGLKREASETRCAQTADASLSVSVTGDASPSNGGLTSKAASQANATATATATVAARATAVRLGQVLASPLTAGMLIMVLFGSGGEG